jgi:ATP-dependent protease HslVU (ClpYQ) peptidase subunit
LSVIACEVTDQEVIIAADSAISFGDNQWIDPSAKLHIIDDSIVLAGAGNLDALMSLKFFLEEETPEEPTEGHVFEFMRQFRIWHTSSNVSFHIEGCADLDSPTVAILGFGGKAFIIEGSYVREIETHAAMGTGMQGAMAAFHLGVTAEEAVATACHVARDCRLPVSVARINKKDLTIEHDIVYTSAHAAVA